MPSYRRKPTEKQEQESLPACERTDKLETRETYCHPRQSRECLIEEQDTLNRWIEYCSELYAHTTTGDPKVLDVPPTTNNDSYHILRGEIEDAIKSLKKGKSAGMDNIPSEQVQARGEAMIDMLFIICNKIWRTGEWPTPLTQSLIITLSWKGYLQLYENCRTMSLISHLSKVMLRILQNRLKPQAEIIKEEQAGFRAGRSTTEQILILEYSVINTCNTSKIFTTSSWTSGRRLTEFCTQFEGNHEAV